MKHVFVVCAYGESPWLSACLDSLRQQREPSPVILCTATPSMLLAEAAREAGAAYRVNAARPGIAGDWNFALSQAREAGAEYATLCHQDDLYLPDYGARLREDAARYPDLQLWFSDYGEMRGEVRCDRSRQLLIKRLLLWRLRFPALQARPQAKRRSLAFGDPICCPAVTYHLSAIPDPLFQQGMNCSLDWQAWERLSRDPGRFCFRPEILMLHRIHPDSTTTQVLSRGERRAQDLDMFRKFWPEPAARALARLYAGSEKSNQL